MCFEVISGLRIKLDKVELIPLGRVDNLDYLASQLGCKVQGLPSSYLGAPFRYMAVWDGGENRFHKRLAKEIVYFEGRDSL